MIEITLAQTLYGFGQAAVASMAAAAVLEAGRKRYDLFGMLLVAISAALGGGSLRDMLLDRPVFWVSDQAYLLTAVGAALLTFFIGRRRKLPLRVFLYTDALGLALGLDDGPLRGGLPFEAAPFTQGGEDFFDGHFGHAASNAASRASWRLMMLMSSGTMRSYCTPSGGTGGTTSSARNLTKKEWLL